MGLRERGCVFCDIVTGSADASIVHRDGQVTAFLDIRPVTPGHLLVIPDHHHASMADIPNDTWRRMMEVSRRAAEALRASDLPADGINLFVADGEVAGQEVAHAHVHVIPRFAGDGFRVKAEAWRQAPPSRERLDRQAEAIRSALTDRW